MKRQNNLLATALIALLLTGAACTNTNWWATIGLSYGWGIWQIYTRRTRRWSLCHAGASLPVRDAVDSRIIEEVRGGYATYEGQTYKEQKRQPDLSKKSGIIDSQNDVGGWPVLNSLPAPEDSDHDGMPDEWEKAQKLNPNNPNDRNLTDKDGWTNLERYLNGLAHPWIWVL